MSQREFSRALITEVTIPAMDGAAKDAAYFTLKFAPEYTRTTKASGKVAGGAVKADQKLWRQRGIQGKERFAIVAGGQPHGRTDANRVLQSPDLQDRL